MKLNQRLGLILLAIWLVVQGLVGLFDIGFEGLDVILVVLAMAAGAVLLIALIPGGIGGNIGLLLLGIWLVVRGLVSLLDIGIGFLGTLLALVAVAAGVLILLGR